MQILLQNTLIMALQKRLLKGFLAAFVMLLWYAPFTNAQTVTEIINNPDNSIVFRIENLNTDNSPTKILLVYDSNLITLETTSVKTNMYHAKSNTASSMMKYSPAAALASTLAVELEKELEVEEWMLEPFTIAQNTNDYLKTDSEEELSIEEWMYDLNSW